MITKIENIVIKLETDLITLDIQEDKLFTLNKTELELNELFTSSFELEKVHQIFNKLNQQEKLTAKSQTNLFLVNT